MSDTAESTLSVRVGRLAAVSLAKLEDGQPVLALSLMDDEGVSFSAVISNNDVLVELLKQLSPPAVNLAFMVDSANPGMAKSLVALGSLAAIAPVEADDGDGD